MACPLIWYFSSLSILYGEGGGRIRTPNVCTQAAKNKLIDNLRISLTMIILSIFVVKTSSEALSIMLNLALRLVTWVALVFWSYASSAAPRIVNLEFSCLKCSHAFTLWSNTRVALVFSSNALWPRETLNCFMCQDFFSKSKKLSF